MRFDSKNHIVLMTVLTLGLFAGGLDAQTTTDPAALDLDGDGVPNTEDNCPHIPNPPVNGVQPSLCGRELGSVIDQYTFLKSRTFTAPPEGSVPSPGQLPQTPRVHVLLHVIPSPDGVMLRPARREALAGLGVTVLDYVPHNTYYASLPRGRLQDVVALEFVRAISAITPADRTSPQVRVRGPLNGLRPDGTASVDVTFFADTPAQAIGSVLQAGGTGHEMLFDTTYRVSLANPGRVAWLGAQDTVSWIEDTPDEGVDDTLNGQIATGATVPIAQLGLTGAGLTVSMVESGQPDPLPHPNMNGRVTLGNSPIFAADGDHARVVAAIMIADGSNGLSQNAGLLPQAQLLSYSRNGLTVKRQHFGVNEEARQDFGALLSNNSWSTYNCGQRGEYTKRAKFFDKAVYEAGISIIKSAGNGRNGNRFDGCPMDFWSLPAPSASKNAIVVGNMGVSSGGTLGVLDDSSSAGPTADGRLKPDLVAPGGGLQSIDFNFTTNAPFATTFGGTSAAAPFAAGVVGLVADTFQADGVDPLTVAAARYKAILVHTARDEGVTGPDFQHGYGLVQPEAAVRIADEWSLWGRESTLDANTTSFDVPFVISSPHSAFKVTLVWDDEEGEETSTMALKNDLDLVLTSPSGAVHRPYDVASYTAGDAGGTAPCTSVACVDRFNNVEMALATPLAGLDVVEQGTWHAVVTFHRLVSASQAFSLVLTPDCPVIIDRNVTLTGDILCSASTVDAIGVKIVTPGAELDCDGHLVEAVSVVDGSRGIVPAADDVTVRNCRVEHFDVGIDVDPANGASSRNVLTGNELRLNASRAISVTGADHQVSGNNVSQMLNSDGEGVFVSGKGIDVLSNMFGFAYQQNNGGNTVAVLVWPGSTFGAVSDNEFSGLWRYGIQLIGDGVSSYSVANNTFEGIGETPIVLQAGVVNTSVVGNEMEAYALAVPGFAAPGILVTSTPLLIGSGRPSGNTVSANTITGADATAQIGIRLYAAEDTQVSGNGNSGVGRGIVEESSTGSYITGNQVGNPLGAFVSKVGIESKSSTGSTNGHIMQNAVGRAQVGISVDRPVASVVASNTVSAQNTAIAVSDAAAGLSVSNNTVSAATGVSVVRAPNALVTSNHFVPVNPGTGGGVFIDQCQAVVASGNTAVTPAVGLSVSNSAFAQVSSNEVTDPSGVGILLSGTSDAAASGNEVTQNAAVGIALAAGSRVLITGNTVSSVGAGVGIQLGNGFPATCADDVDDVDLIGNTLTGGAVNAVTVLCDVGTYTITP